MSLNLEEFFSTNVMAPGEAAGHALSALEMYRESSPGTVLYFGFPELDEVIAMIRGGYYLLAARPGVGKTAFLMQLVGNLVPQLPDDGVVVLFSAEMDVSSLLLREACGRVGVSYWDMVRGKLGPDDFARVRAALKDGSNSRLFIDQHPAPTLEHMGQQIEVLQEAGKHIGAVLFDYLQLSGEFDGSEKQRVDKISRGLAALAKRFNCQVLALGQTNRKSDDDSFDLSSLMYGGEQQPTGVMILDRPYLRNPDPSLYAPNQTDVHVVKHRHGPMGKVTLIFDAATMRFRSAVVKRVALGEGEPVTVGQWPRKEKWRG